MGFQLLLLMFAGVTLGGLGTAYGALVGSLVVGMVVEMSTLVVPPELKNVGALLILILILAGAAAGHPRPGRAGRVGRRTWTGPAIFENTLAAAVGRDAIIYALAAIGLNVHFGYTGLLNFGQVGFMAIGGYGVGHQRARVRAARCGSASCSGHRRRGGAGAAARHTRRCGCGPTTWPS